MEPGPSINETYWGKLDELTRKLLGTEAAEDVWDLDNLKGQAYGIAWCLAVMANPYNPSLTEIRAEALRRYHARPQA